MNSTDPNTQPPTKRNTNTVLGIIVVIFVAAIVLLLIGDGLREAVDPDVGDNTPVTLEATIDDDIDVVATEADLTEPTQADMEEPVTESTPGG